MIECDLVDSKTAQLYLTSEKIGSGMQGSIFKGYQGDLELAAKVMPLTEKNKKFVDSELQTMRTLPQHPALVHVHPNYFFTQQNCIVLMELCDGSLLNLLNRRNGRLKNREEFLQLFYQLTMGYQCLYTNGILHLDLKLENVLIKDKHFKIADFGLSRLASQQKPVKMAGTLRYMSKERLVQKGEYVPSVKYDLYSLGVLFFICLTGKHPYLDQYKYGQRLTPKICMDAFLSRRALPPLPQNTPVDFSPLVQVIHSLIKIQPGQRMQAQQLFNFVKLSKLFNFTREKTWCSSISDSNDRVSSDRSKGLQFKVRRRLEAVVGRMRPELNCQKQSDLMQQQVRKLLDSRQSLSLFLARFGMLLDQSADKHQFFNDVKKQAIQISAISSVLSYKVLQLSMTNNCFLPVQKLRQNKELESIYFQQYEEEIQGIKLQAQKLTCKTTLAKWVKEVSQAETVLGTLACDLRARILAMLTGGVFLVSEKENIVMVLLCYMKKIVDKCGNVWSNWSKLNFVQPGEEFEIEGADPERLWVQAQDWLQQLNASLAIQIAFP